MPKGRTATEVYRNYTLALAKLNARKLFEGVGEGPLGMKGASPTRSPSAPPQSAPPPPADSAFNSALFVSNRIPYKAMWPSFASPVEIFDRRHLARIHDGALDDSQLHHHLPLATTMPSGGNPSLYSMTYSATLTPEWGLRTGGVEWGRGGSSKEPARGTRSALAVWGLVQKLCIKRQSPEMFY